MVGSIAELCNWSLMPHVEVGETMAELSVGGKGSETNKLGGGEDGSALGNSKNDVMGEAVRDPSEWLGELRGCGEMRAASAKEQFRVVLGELRRVWSIAVRVVTVDSSEWLSIRTVAVCDCACEGLD